MKILIYAGISPGINASIEDLLTKKYDCGGNVGNLMFINAVAESVDPNFNIKFIPTKYRSEFTDAEIDWINNECSFFLLPLADAFRDDNANQLQNLAKTISKLKIPCIVAGVGLRAEYEGDVCEKHHFDSAVSEFVNAVLDKSSVIGLRGDNTARYLNNLGYKEGKHFVVIGCPSMCMAAGEERFEFNAEPGHKLNNIALNGNDFSPDCVNSLFRQIARDYSGSVIIQQREAEMMDIYLSRYSEVRKKFFRKKGSLYGSALYDQLMSERRIKGFSNIPEWVEFLKNMDFCLNTRFHGNVACILAGIPSVIIPIDSRTDELIRYHGLPTVSKEEVEKLKNLDELIAWADYTTFKQLGKGNLRNYLSFLERNGIQHVNETIQLKFIQKETACLEAGFRDLNLNQKLKRIVGYYSKRIGNKMENKNESLILEEESI